MGSRLPIDPKEMNVASRPSALTSLLVLLLFGILLSVPSIANVPTTAAHKGNNPRNRASANAGALFFASARMLKNSLGGI